jgi:hypothetical protein
MVKLLLARRPEAPNDVSNSGDNAAPMLAVTAGSDGDGRSAQPNTDSRQYQAILPRRPAIGDFLLSCHTRSLLESMKTLHAAMVTCPLACHHEQQLVEGMAWLA